MTRILPISEVKARLPELITGIEECEEEIIVTRKGKPAAVLVNYAEYERLKETLDVLSDPILMRQIHRSQQFYAQGGKGLSFEERIVAVGHRRGIDEEAAEQLRHTKPPC